MAYLRFFDGGFDNWFQPDARIEHLVKRLYSKSRPDNVPSIFLATSDTEEVQTAAAWKIKKGQSLLQKCFGLRVRDEDLQALGLVAGDPMPGDTGVPAVDARHYDLKRDDGSLIKFEDAERLIEQVLRELVGGGDRVRVFGKNQLAFQFSDFLRGGAGSLNPQSATLYQRCLENLVPP
jgi:hypothetical protein